MLLVSLLGIQSFFRNTDKIKMVSIKIFIWAAARGRPPGRPLLIEEVPGSLPRSQLDGPEIWAYWQAYIHTAHIRYQYTPNDHNLFVPHFMQTPVKYIFSESLRIVDYECIFIKIKKLRLSEYSIQGYNFPKVHVQRFTKQVCFRLNSSGRTWPKLLHVTRLAWSNMWLQRGS